MHTDRVLVHLLRIDPPGDLGGIDVDRETFSYLVDRDVGVIPGSDVHPSLAALYRPTL